MSIKTKKKTSLRPLLEAINEDFANQDVEGVDKRLSLFGKCALTHIGYNNSTRTNMNTSHISQFLNLRDPDFPHVYFGAEMTVGDNSSGYLKIKDDAVVVDKIVKFDDLCEDWNTEPQIYALFLYYPEKDKYDLIIRQPVENLSEVFGFSYNDEYMDNLKSGDKISKDTVIYKSNSYDEDMLYGFGKDANVMYTLDPTTIEDAAAIRKGFADNFASDEVEQYRVGLNTNDFLLNVYGDKDTYKTLPHIGESADGIVCASRRQFNNQLLYDFKTSSLQEIIDGDKVYYGNGKIVDYTVYINDQEFEDNPFTHDIYTIWQSQLRFWTKINEVCDRIINKSNSEYSRDVDYYYKLSNQHLDTKAKWRDADRTYGDIVIDITIDRVVTVDKGQKITPRYGNKSVTGVLVEDEDMPYIYNEDGSVTRADVLINLLAIINRTTAFPLYELTINWFCTKCIRYMRTLKSKKKQEEVLFEFLNDMNEDYAIENRVIYDRLSDKEQKEYLKDVMYGDGIYIRELPLNEKVLLFDRVIKIYQKYDWLTDDITYINKFGREIPILSRYRLAKMYVMKLKQTSRKGFSARNMGAINSKSLPERSYNKKVHLDRVSSTPIRFGEYESMNFQIGVKPEEYLLFQELYRTSVKGRKDLAKILIDPDKDFGYIDDSYTSRTAEILNVVLMSLGYKNEFINEKNRLKDYTGHVESIHINKESYLLDDLDATLLENVISIEEDIYSEKPLIDKDELIDIVRERLSSGMFVSGSVDSEDIERIINLRYN